MVFWRPRPRRPPQRSILVLGAARIAQRSLLNLGPGPFRTDPGRSGFALVLPLVSFFLVPPLWVIGFCLMVCVPFPFLCFGSSNFIGFTVFFTLLLLGDDLCNVLYDSLMEIFNLWIHGAGGLCDLF